MDWEGLTDQSLCLVLGQDQNRCNQDGTGLETSRIQEMGQAGISTKTNLMNQEGQFLGDVTEEFPKMKLDGTGLEINHIQKMDRAGILIIKNLWCQGNQYLENVKVELLKMNVDGIGLEISQTKKTDQAGISAGINRMSQENQFLGSATEAHPKMNVDGIGLGTSHHQALLGRQETTTTMMEKDHDLLKQRNRKDQHGIGDVIQKRMNQKAQDRGPEMDQILMILSGVGLALNHLRTRTSKIRQLPGRRLTRTTTTARDPDRW